MATDRGPHRREGPRHGGSPHRTVHGADEDLGQHLQRRRHHSPTGPAPCHSDGALRRSPVHEFGAAMALLRRGVEGATLAEKMRVTLASLREHIDETTVWGGDWNQALEGRDYVGSLDGRKEILQLVNDSQLSVPTSALGSASKGIGPSTTLPSRRLGMSCGPSPGRGH